MTVSSPPLSGNWDKADLAVPASQSRAERLLIWAGEAA